MSSLSSTAQFERLMESAHAVAEAQREAVAILQGGGGGDGDGDGDGGNSSRSGDKDGDGDGWPVDALASLSSPSAVRSAASPGRRVLAREAHRVDRQAVSRSI